MKEAFSTPVLYLFAVKHPLKVRVGILRSTVKRTTNMSVTKELLRCCQTVSSVFEVRGVVGDEDVLARVPISTTEALVLTTMLAISC